MTTKQKITYDTNAKTQASISSLMMNNNEQVLEQSKVIILNKVLEIKD